MAWCETCTGRRTMKRFLTALILVLAAGLSACSGPAGPSAIEIAPPMPLVPMGKGTVNLALLGSDIRPNDGGWRTDTILIVSLDPSAGRARVVAIPRDLYVYIPGWRVDRINVADVHGGFEILAQTILYNFGIPIDPVMGIYFSGFT